MTMILVLKSSNLNVDGDDVEILHHVLWLRGLDWGAQLPFLDP